MTDAIIRRLRRADRAAFIAVMSEAFVGDPLFVAAFGDVAAGRSASNAFLAFLFDMNRIMGGSAQGLFVGDRLAACALLEPPSGGPLATGVGLAASILRFLPVACRLSPRSTAFLNDYMRRTRTAAPAGPHHYLVLVGVLRERQGQGLGRRLVEDAIERSLRHPRSTGLALDTENEANVVLYERWGFLRTTSVDIGEVTAHCMFRPTEERP